MLKVTIENGRCTVESSGSILQIIIDAARAVGAIYEGMKDADSLDAEFFKMGIIYALKVDSPAWGLMEKADDAYRIVMHLQNKKVAVPPPVKVRAPHDLNTADSGAA